MTKSIFLSLVFHSIMIIITALSLPFMKRTAIDLPQILSVDLIQITDKTSIPYAERASKILEEIKKKEEERIVSQQAPPAQKKKELFDPNQIAALIDKSKEEKAKTLKKSNKLTQDSVKNSFVAGLTLSQEDALKAQIFGCWSLPLGLPYQDNLLVRIKLKLRPDGTVIKSEILDHVRMNMPGQGFYKVLAESALRAIRICQPLRVPPTGYEKWKDLQLNFDANEMLKG